MPPQGPPQGKKRKPAEDAGAPAAKRGRGKPKGKKTKDTPRGKPSKFQNKNPLKYSRAGRLAAKGLPPDTPKAPKMKKPKPPKEADKEQPPPPPALVKRQLLQDTTLKWEAIRRHDLGKDERAPLVASVLEQAKGKLAQLAQSHTGSRVVQACVKFGSEEERAQVMAELRPAMLDLAKSSYAHFTLIKLLSLAPKRDIPGLVREVLPHVAHLLRHPTGAAVVSALWDRAPGEMRDAIASVFYGKEFSVLSQGKYPTGLGELLKSTHTAAKRAAIMQQLTLKLTPIMEKGMVDALVTHRLLAEFMQHSRSQAVAEAVEQLAGPVLLRMIHTQPGAYVGCAVFTHGTAKDRKKAVKAMKGHVAVMAKDGWGHVVLMAALTYTDDTALLRKVIIPDLLENLDELAEDTHGSKVLLQLVRPGSSVCLPPQELAMLTLDQRSRRVPASLVPPPEKGEEAPAAAAAQASASRVQDPEAEAATKSEPEDEEAEEDEEAMSEDAAAEPTAGAADAAGAAEAAGAAPPEQDGEAPSEELVVQIMGVCKKAPLLRRQEVLGAGPGSLADAIVRLCAANADALLRDDVGWRLMAEVATGGDGGVLGDAEALEPVHAAILALCQAPWPAEGHILEDWHGSRAVRALVQACSRKRVDGQVARGFTRRLWDQALVDKDQSALLQSSAAKVVHALCECMDKELRELGLARFPDLRKPPKKKGAKQKGKSQTKASKARKAEKKKVRALKAARKHKAKQARLGKAKA